MSFPGPTKTIGRGTDLSIRFATPADADAIAVLGLLDEARVPTGTVFVAQVGEEIWAAVSADDLHAVADPFRPSGELVFLLVERARQWRRAHRPRTGLRDRLRTRRPALA